MPRTNLSIENSSKGFFFVVSQGDKVIRHRLGAEELHRIVMFCVGRLYSMARRKS